MTPEIVDAEIVEHGTDLELAAAPSPTLFGTDDPVEFIASATRTATALANVVRAQRLIARIGQSDHVRVEGWTLLGSMLGVYAVTAWTRPIERDGERWGWEARVEARDRVGALRGAAEAQCTRDERTWKSRDDYALRSMAQTRATSKALRQPLGFVMQLAGFNPTPAEEMPAARRVRDSGLEPSGANTERPAADAQASAEAEGSASSPDVAADECGASAVTDEPLPPGWPEPADMKLWQDADKLTEQLIELSVEFGSDPMKVAQSAASNRTLADDEPKGHVAWLERQIETVRRNIQAREDRKAFDPPLASQKQRTLMVLRANEAGLDDDARHALVERVTGQPSTNGVRADQVQAVLDAIAEVTA